MIKYLTYRGRRGTSFAAAGQVLGLRSGTDDSAFYEGLRNRDLDQVKSCLAESPELCNKRDVFSGETPLHLAIDSDFQKGVELLLAKGADPNAANDQSESALQRAVRRRQSGIARLLLKAGGDSNAEGLWRGMLPLSLAARDGDESMVALLLEHGAKPNGTRATDFGPLHQATLRGNCRIIEMLIAAGAKVDAISKPHGTSLQVAMEKRHRGAQQILIAHGADQRVARAVIKEKQKLARKRAFKKASPWLLLCAMTFVAVGARLIWLKATNPFYGRYENFTHVSAYHPAPAPYIHGKVISICTKHCGFLKAAPTLDKAMQIGLPQTLQASRPADVGTVILTEKRDPERQVTPTQKAITPGAHLDTV
ncbi:MAG: ankyrin repeat domain-containing protein [Terracidiphilus sp.]|jgi:hypothetical protein